MELQLQLQHEQINNQCNFKPEVSLVESVETMGLEKEQQIIASNITSDSNNINS